MLGYSDILKVLAQLQHDISISQITAQRSDNRARCASSSNSFNSVFLSLLTLWPMSTAILSEPKLPLLHRCSQPRNRTRYITYSRTDVGAQSLAALAPHRLAEMSVCRFGACTRYNTSTNPRLLVIPIATQQCKQSYHDTHEDGALHPHQRIHCSNQNFRPRSPQRMVHQTAWPFSPNLTSRKYLPPLPQSHALTQSSYSITDHHSPIPDSTKIQPASQFRTLSLPPTPPKGQQAPHIYLSPSRPNVHPTHLHARGFTTISASRPRRPPAGSGRSTSYPLRPHSPTTNKARTDA
jgi:hypothetical protein